LACSLLGRRQWARQVKNKVKSVLIIFFDIKGIVHKEFVLKTQGSIPHTAVRCYGDCVTIFKDFVLKFGDKITGYCITTTYRLAFLFKKKTIWLLPPPTLFSLFPRLKAKLRGHNFDTIDVIESAWKAVLNTLTEHSFQGALKKQQKYWER
jgi:hypothetical protein